MALPRLLLLSALAVSMASCTNSGSDSAKSAQDCTGPTATLDSASLTGTVGSPVTITGSGTVCSGDANLSWTLEQVPVESALTTSSLDASDPTKVVMTPDATGDYVLALTVSDSSGTSTNPTYAVVSVGASDGKPVADCGGAQSAKAGAKVEFDGSASSDPEGAALSYNWSLASTPDCSALGESDIYNGNTSMAAVVTDCEGVYVVGLVVSDGQSWSDPAYCALTATSGNEIPVADAGDSGTLSPCTDASFQLDGYGSYDPEGQGLTYQWSLVSAPAGSTTSDANFDDATMPNPLFTWDLAGDYTFQLQVYDGVQWSVPDLVTYTFTDVGENHAPTANAGEDISITKTPDCETASYVMTCDSCKSVDETLDGTASADDVDGDTLHFAWSQSGGSDLTFTAPYAASTKVATPEFDSVYNTTVTKSWTVDLAVSDCADTAHDQLTITYSCTASYSP